MEKASAEKESTKRGMGILALALALALALFALIATSLAAAQSTETPSTETQNPLELYDENDDGVIDADEAIAAAVDYLDGNIDRDLASRVMDLYLAVHGQVTGQSQPAACVEYDHNGNGVIDQAEAQAAADDYEAGTIDRDKAIQVIACYFDDAPSPTPTPVPPTPIPTPTPVPPTPTPTPDPLDLYDENENGVIDADELITSVSDYFAGRIDRALALRVWRLYKAGAGASGASGESRAAVCDTYDAIANGGNYNGVVDRDEVLKGIDDHYDDTLPKEKRLTRDTTIRLINCYFDDPPPPQPPTGLVLNKEEGDDDDLGLAFTLSTDSDDYNNYKFELHRSTSQDGTYSVVSGATQNVSASPVDFDGQSTRHWYKARGRNCQTSSRLKCGVWSDWSDPIYLPTPPPPPTAPPPTDTPVPRPVPQQPLPPPSPTKPSAPTGLKSMARSIVYQDSEIVLDWRDVSGTGVTYEVQQKKERWWIIPDGWETLSGDKITTNGSCSGSCVVIVGLDYNKSYTHRVRAVRSGLTSDWSTELETPTPLPHVGHQADHTVKYEYGSSIETNPLSVIRPSIRSAIKAWNDAVSTSEPQLLFCEDCSVRVGPRLMDRNTDARTVVINQASTETRPLMGQQRRDCGPAMACVKSRDGNILNYTDANYHMNNLELVIEEPPTAYNPYRKTYENFEWTMDPSSHLEEVPGQGLVRPTYFHLPTVVKHELGHTAGLADLDVFGSYPGYLMYRERESIADLTRHPGIPSTDVNYLRGVYRGHVVHRISSR